MLVLPFLPFLSFLLSFHLTLKHIFHCVCLTDFCFKAQLECLSKSYCKLCPSQLQSMAYSSGVVLSQDDSCVNGVQILANIECYRASGAGQSPYWGIFSVHRLLLPVADHRLYCKLSVQSFLWIKKPDYDFLYTGTCEWNQWQRCSFCTGEVFDTRLWQYQEIFSHVKT